MLLFILVARELVIAGGQLKEKNKIMTSRTESTSLLAETLANLKQPLKFSWSPVPLDSMGILTSRD